MLLYVAINGVLILTALISKIGHVRSCRYYFPIKNRAQNPRIKIHGDLISPSHIAAAINVASLNIYNRFWSIHPHIWNWGIVCDCLLSARTGDSVYLQPCNSLKTRHVQSLEAPQWVECTVDVFSRNSNVFTTSFTLKPPNFFGNISSSHVWWHHEGQMMRFSRPHQQIKCSR